MSLTPAHRFAAIFPALALLLILGTGWLAFQPSLSGPFLLDDGANINPLAVRTFSWAELKAPLLTGSFRGFSRILTRLSLAFTLHVAGDNAGRFKQENLLLHLANALLLCWLAALLVRAARISRQAGGVRTPDAPAEPNVRDWWPALLICAFWLLHPLHVSTVAYVVQRLVVMSAFFSLLTMVCYVKGRLLLWQQPIAGFSLIMVGLLLFWPMALLSKENAALTAPALLAAEWFLLRFAAPSVWPKRVLWLFVGACLVFPCVLALAYFGLEHERLLNGYMGRDFDVWDRMLTQVHALWLYLKLILLPVPGAMALFHDDFPIQRSLDIATSLAAAGLMALLAGAFALRRAAPLIGFGLVWFFIWHAMESSVFPLEMVFEHRNYLALFGPMLALAAVFVQLADHRLDKRALISAALAVVVLLGLNTLSRAYTWSDVDRLAAAEYQQNANSPRATGMMLERAVANGRMDLVPLLLQQMRILTPNTSLTLLQELNFRCRDSHPPEQLLKSIYERIATSILRPGEVEQLRQLRRSIAAGHCPAISEETLLDLAAAAAANTRVHTRNTRIGALNLYASIAAEQQDFASAEAALRKSVAAAVGAAPAWMIATLQVTVEAAHRLHSDEAAAAFVTGVIRGHEEVLRARRITLDLLSKTPSNQADALQHTNAGGGE